MVATAETRAHPGSRPMAVPSSRPFGRWVEPTAVLALLSVALIVRVVGREEIEPNILPDEADHLALMYRILAGRGPSPFDLSWDGNPAFSLYPSLLALYLFGGGYAALRLSVAVASVLMLGVFYVVCRDRCSPVAALAATGLLAFSEWGLFFSRNGEVNIFVALYALLAAYWLQRALGGTSRWPWAMAGFWAGMGWYGFLAGIFILPSLILALLPRIVRERPRRRVVEGTALLVAVCALTVLPRVPFLYARWADVQTYVNGRSVLREAPPAEIPRMLAAQTAQVARAYLVLDPTLRGNARYSGPDRAPLDPLSGTLYVGGLVLAMLSFSQSALWLALWVVPLAATQVPTTNIPDLARAIAALPACFLFVGLGVERLVRSVAGPLLWAAVLLTVPAIGWANWQAYTSWMATPAAAQAREPAVDYDEFHAWQAEQQRRAGAGELALTVNQWRDEHPRAASSLPRGRAAPAAASDDRSSPRPSGVGPRLEPVSVTPLYAIEGDDGVQEPRGIAATPDGQVWVANPNGGTFRLDSDRRALVDSDRQSAALPETWDLAAGPDGLLHMVDSERGVVVKLTPDGGVVATFGRDWQMYRPRGLDVGRDGRMYVADTGRDRIVIASPEGRLLGTVGPTAAVGELDQPTDVVVDDAGRLYVALPESGRLEVLDERGGRLGGWDIGRGTTIESPRLALTPAGGVVVSEPADRRVRIFDGGGGQLGQVERGLTAPFGVAVRGTHLYVTEPTAGRVVAFSLDPP